MLTEATEPRDPLGAPGGGQHEQDRPEVVGEHMLGEVDRLARAVDVLEHDQGGPLGVEGAQVGGDAGV